MAVIHRRWWFSARSAKKRRRCREMRKLTRGIQRSLRVSQPIPVALGKMLTPTPKKAEEKGAILSGIIRELGD